MKLLESYSMGASVPIKHKPTLLEKFFPLGEITKYITLQSNTGMQAKNFSYWQQVIDILHPTLEKNGIKIIHLGDSAAPVLQKVVDLRNQTSLQQSKYLIKRALCHVGGDSILAHISGAENTPLVEIFGPTSVENHSPYFYNKEKTVFIESHRNGNKPSFNPNEIPQTIQYIRPEEISAAVLKLLNLENTFSYKTVFIGETFPRRTIEGIPDQIIDIQQLGLDNLIIRGDFSDFNADFIYNQVQRNKCSIVTSKPLNIDILKQLKNNISQIVYEVKKDYDLNFIKQIARLGINWGMWTHEPEEWLNGEKLNFLDYGMVNLKKPRNPAEIKELKDKDLNKLYFQTCKFTLSQSKIFPSFAHCRAEISVPNFEFNPIPVINNQEFWNELENYWVLEKI